MKKVCKNYIEYKKIDILDEHYIFIPETLLFFKSTPFIEEILPKFNRLDEKTLLAEYTHEEEQLIPVLAQLNEIQQEISFYKQQSLMPKNELTIKSLEINVAQSCNLRCKYCFAGDGTHGKAVMMNRETAKKVIDYFFESNMLATDEIYLIFLGGEALLNFPIIHFLLEYAVKKGDEKGIRVSFSMTTNGTKLDREIMTVLKAYNVNVMISMDSRNKESHNYLRPMANGTGSYDALMANGWSSLLASPKKAAVQMTVTPYNLDIFENSKFFYDAGFYHVQIEKVKSDRAEWKLSQEMIKKAGAEYIKLTHYLLKKLSEDHEISNSPLLSFLDFIHLHNRKPRRNRCSMLWNSICVSAEGNFYPCDGFMWDSYKIGSLQEGLNRQRIETLRREMQDHSQCSLCWARNLCDKGCALEKKSLQGLLKYDDCELKQLICKLQLYIYDWISTHKSDYLTRFEKTELFSDQYGSASGRLN